MASCRGESLRTCAPTPIVCPNSLRLWLDLALSLGAAGNQHLVIGQDPPLDGLYVHLGERFSQLWSVVVSGYGNQWSLSAVVVAATRCHRRGLSFAVIGR